MPITRETLVKDALDSSPSAPALFQAHGVNPAIACRSVFTRITLAQAVDHCGLERLDELIEALNAAIGK